MGQIIIRNLDDSVILELKRRAKSKKVSLEQHMRDVAAKSLEPTREELWADIDRIRNEIGPVSGDSTDLIREDRDNDEPYR